MSTLLFTALPGLRRALVAGGWAIGAPYREERRFGQTRCLSSPRNIAPRDIPTPDIPPRRSLALTSLLLAVVLPSCQSAPCEDAALCDTNDSTEKHRNPRNTLADTDASADSGTAPITAPPPAADASPDDTDDAGHPTSHPSHPDSKQLDSGLPTTLITDAINHENGTSKNGGDSGADAGTCPPGATAPHCLTPCTRRADCAALCADASDDDAAADDTASDDCSFFCNANGVCVHDAPGTECTAHEDCTRAGARLCADGHCVSCLPTDPMLGDNAGCADDILCRIGDTPRQNTCEECVTHDDCDGNAGGGPEFAECHDGTCVVCSAPSDSDDPTQAADSCPAQAPYCDVNDVKKLSSCVSCLKDNHCAPSQAGSQAGGGVCTAESVCIPCDADTHDGCAFPAAWCLPGNTPLENTCSPCDPATHGGCVAPTPQCLEGDTPLDNTCVACIGDDDCTNPDAPFCDQNTCIACRSHADCTDPNAARCDAGVCTGCNDSTQCAGITGTELCFTDEQRCVQCTKDETSACGDYVCDSREHTCAPEDDAYLRGTAGACTPCLSDDHCLSAHACVLTEFDGEWLDTYYCMPERGVPGGPATCSEDAHPFAAAVESLPTLDGRTGVTVCGLAVSTCEALAHFRSKPCDPDLPDECGVEGLDDGLCRLNNDGVPLCTMPCLDSTGRDCKSGADCITNVTPNFCELN